MRRAAPAWPRALLPLTLLLAACEPEPHRATLPLRLRVEPADTLAPGEHLRMTAHLRNPTRHPLRLEFDDQCQVQIYVQSMDRTVLHPPGGGAACVGAPATLEIPPGDSAAFTGRWMAGDASLGPHIAYAVLWNHRIVRGDERHERPSHRSNVVQFQVLPEE
jgi:hypothetical protein